MDILKKELIGIWETKMPIHFTDGILVYERQLQAFLYHYLYESLPEDYTIWIEPLIYKLGKIKPDIVITRGNDIICVIELKFKPWEDSHYKEDIHKLNKFEDLKHDHQTIDLGIKPFSSNWRKQKGKGV